jgi:D-aminoacyl-tRNA deacylase
MPTILSCNAEQASRLMADHLVDACGFTPAGTTGDAHGAPPFPVFANTDGVKLVRFDNPNTKTDNPIVHTDFLSFLESDLFVFASPHSSAAGRPALTVHPMGNWSEAVPLGGMPNRVGLSSAVAMETAFASLRRSFAKAKEDAAAGKTGSDGRAPLSGFELTLEATHHGPTELGAPGLFVEIGRASCRERV